MIATLAAVGDIMLGRGMCPVVEQTGAGVLAEVVPLLRADIVTGNLECVLTERDAGNPNAHSRFRISPTSAQPLLSMFDVLSVANNHTFDFLDGGVEDTLAALDEMGILHVGVGLSAEAARMPAIVKLEAGSVAVLGASSAVSLPPGGSALHIARPDARFIEAVEDAAAKYDWVIVHLHSGGGDYAVPSPDVRRIHEELRRAGATIVLGHHPHVPGGWVTDGAQASLFSLGDFVFDKREDGRDSALIVRCELSGAPVECQVSLVRRDADLMIHPVEPAAEDPVWQHLLAVNELIAHGTSDEAYMDVAGADFAHVLSGSLRNDLRAGGIKAVFSRLRRLTPRKALRAMGLLWRGLRARLSGGGPR